MTLGRDGIAGLVCLAISIWLLVLTLSLPPAVMVPIGPAFYPRIVLGLMALFSVILIANDVLAALRRRAVAPEVPPAAQARAAVAAPTAEAAAAAESSPNGVQAGHKPNYPLVLATFVLFGIYVLILPYLGFRISTFLFVFVLQPTLEWPRSWQRWLLVAAIALATTIACVVAFDDYLSVLLPRGTLTGM
jgi:hypothetical protein